jgi:hypothetical protein
MGDCVYFKRKEKETKKILKTLARLKEVVLCTRFENTHRHCESNETKKKR